VYKHSCKFCVLHSSIQKSNIISMTSMGKSKACAEGIIKITAQSKLYNYGLLWKDLKYII